MKGLLLKDLYNTRRLTKQYAVVGIFMLIWSIATKSSSMFITMAIMLGSMSVLTSMSYDELAHFEKYALTLPVTKRDLVSSKYLYFLLLISAGYVIGALGGFAINFVLKTGTDGIFEMLLSGLGIGGVFVLSMSVLIPLVFRYGVEKSRVILVLVYLLVGGGLYGGFLMLLKAGFVFSDGVLAGMLLGVAALAVLVMAVSYWISLRVVEKKEW